jgi:predicted transcriptional regulator
VYSIRLNPDEVAALQSLAETVGVPGSTLARSWIVERIQEEQAGLTDPETELRAAALLRRGLKVHEAVGEVVVGHGANSCSDLGNAAGTAREPR